jgi:hypothetical protein
MLMQDAYYVMFALGCTFDKTTYTMNEAIPLTELILYVQLNIYYYEKTKLLSIDGSACYDECTGYCSAKGQVCIKYERSARSNSCSP